MASERWRNDRGSQGVSPDGWSLNRIRTVLERRRLELGALFAAACGAIIAVGARPALQVPVESGQVLAGLVSYPTDNPFYIYHVKLWTLLNQGAAALLRAGLSEVAASLVIEGITGALSFLALYLIVYALCNRTVIAVLVPLFVYYFDYVGISIAYPIWLLGTTHTYGIFGLSYAIMVVGMFGVGWYRSGALLAGLAVAFHPSLGAFCVVVSVAALWLQRRKLEREIGPIVRFFLAGLAMTAASFLVQRHFAVRVSGTDPARQWEYLDAFIRNFDYHRSFSGWQHSGLALGLLTAAFSVAAWRRQGTPTGARTVFAATAVSVGAGILAAFLAQFVPPLEFLKILMPWRYLNFANLCMIPLAAGYLAADYAGWPRLRAALLAVVFAAGAVWRFYPARGLYFFYFGIALLTLVVVLLPRDRQSSPSSGGRPRWPAGVAAAGVLILCLLTVLPAARSFVTNRAYTPDIYRFASERPGLLLTAGDMHLVQLLTRRPVLLDGGGLDLFSYVPETGPRFNDILKKVYGLDVFVAPPADERNKATISFSHQELWERRTVGQWKKIHKEFGVTDVLTPADWKLQLPLAATDGEMDLYAIP